MQRYKKLIFYLITILLILSISYYSLYFYVQHHEAKLREEAIRANILDGVQAEPVKVAVDYGKVIGTGSPLVFGGAHAPYSKEAWDKIADVGVTSIRTDFFLEYSLPRDIALNDYVMNKNDIQNPKNWNEKFIQERLNTYKNAKDRGMEVMAIVSYAPPWLTYSATEHGVPKDWSVYEDIVQKLYRIHRDYIDYVEIWNEPTHRYFLDLTNSPYGREEAYSLIFEHAAKAIREVDEQINDGKKIVIGAQISHDPYQTSILSYLLKQEHLLPYIDFVSYHNYVTDEPAWDGIKKIIEESNKKNLPVMLTEWNYDSNEKEDNVYKTGNEAIIFTADRLMTLLKMGIMGANYYSLFPLERKKVTLGHGYLAFYENTAQGVWLLPQVKSWRLLSKTLGLGTGVNRIVESSVSELTNTIGFINFASAKGVVAVNRSDAAELVEFTLINTGIDKRSKINIYLASANYDGTAAIGTRTVYPDPESHALVFRYLQPANSVVGIKISEEKEWYDILDPLYPQYNN